MTLLITAVCCAYLLSISQSLLVGYLIRKGFKREGWNCSYAQSLGVIKKSEKKPKPNVHMHDTRKERLAFLKIKATLNLFLTEVRTDAF